MNGKDTIMDTMPLSWQSTDEAFETFYHLSILRRARGLEPRVPDEWADYVTRVAEERRARGARTLAIRTFRFFVTEPQHRANAGA